MKYLITILLSTLICLSAAAFAQERITHVTTDIVGKRVIYPEFSVPATTMSINESRISAETSGRILVLPVLVGDEVKKGQLLARLDCRNNIARLEQARASLDAVKARDTLAQRQIKRTLSLRQSQNVSEELLNQREANLDTAKAEIQAQSARLEEAELEVKRCEIIAPYTGIVLERLRGEGEWVTPGQPVIHLLDSERLEVSAQVPVDQIISLKGASSFTLSTNQGDYSLAIRRVLPVVGTRGRNREVRFLFSSEMALSGSTGRLTWRSSIPHLSADLPVRRGDSLGVFLAVDGKASFHPLPNALEGQPAPVSLPKDSRIVIEGRHGLSHNSPIKSKQDAACCPSAGKE